MKLIHTFIFAILFVSCSKNRQISTEENSKDSIKILLELSTAKTSTYNERLTYNNKSLNILLKQANDSINRENLFKVAWNYYYANSWDKLHSTTRIIYQKSKQKNDDNHLAKSYRFYGLFFENTNNNDSAFYYYLKAEKIYKKLNNYEELCQIYKDKALTQFYVNDYLGSQLTLIDALKIAKENNFKKHQFYIYTLLGINSSELQDFSSASENYLKGLDLARRYGKEFKRSDQFVAQSLNNIGYNYYKTGNLKKAITFYKNSLKQKNFKEDLALSYCITLDNLAYCKFKLKDFNNLPNLYFKAAKIRDSLNIDQGKNFNKLYLSEYYSAVKDTPNAQKYAHEAYNLSKNFRAPKDMLLCLKQLVIAEPENALKYSDEYIKISDSMQQLERETRNKFAKIAYETEEITSQKDEAIHQKWIFLGIAILIFFVGVLVFIIISQRIRQKELQFTQEQQKNNEEIYQLIQTRQSKIDEGREIEKKRIAQDLHDGIMNRLTSTRLNLHILNERKDIETIKKCLPFIDGIQNIEKEIRNIAHNLNKDVFSNNDSFIAIIESLFNEQKSTSKINCHLEIDNEINWDAIESSKKIHIYRIFQEAFNNTNKHANAQNIVASILNQENHILVEIYDDGSGFSLNGKKKGIGLQNIFSRVKSCNGTIEIKTKKGEGTTLIITIPKKPKTKPPDNGNTNTHLNS